MAKKFEPIGFWAGKSLLVAKNDTGGIIFELAHADEAAARATLVRARHKVLLRAAVKRRSRILRNNVVVDPIFQCGSRARVNVVLRRIAGENAALLDDDQVVRVGGIILLLHGRRNFVVRLSEHAVKRGARRIVAEGAKGMNLSHGVSGVNLSGMRSPLFYANTARFRKRVEGLRICAATCPWLESRRRDQTAAVYTERIRMKVYG